jgi:hypothetical protein
MSNLLDLYTEMNKTAEEKVVANEKIAAITEYASAAEEVLSEKLGDNYDEDDVIKVASAMIENDLVVAEEQEKVAEYDQLGRIMAHSFNDELNKLKTED